MIVNVYSPLQAISPSVTQHDAIYIYTLAHTYTLTQQAHTHTHSCTCTHMYMYMPVHPAVRRAAPCCITLRLEFLMYVTIQGCVFRALQICSWIYVSLISRLALINRPTILSYVKMWLRAVSVGAEGCWFASHMSNIPKNKHTKRHSTEYDL